MSFSSITSAIPFLRYARHRNVNAYTKSFIRSQLNNTSKKKIAFLDIDSTMTGNPETTNKTRQLLEEQGYAIVYVSTRTEEAMMTKDAYEKSIKSSSFNRPRPYLAKKGNTHSYIAPEHHEPAGLLDPDIIVGSTGTQILVRQRNGSYMVDTAFEQNFSQEATYWKKMTLNLLHQIDPHHTLGIFSNVDHEANYHARNVNVSPPKYRIGLNFKTVKNKIAFIKKLQKISIDDKVYGPIREQYKHMRIIDDSNPEANKYRMYLTPKKASKAVAVEHIVHKICQETKVERSELHILLAGDSFPDLEMGMQGGMGTNATFLLVGGSRLTEVLMSETIHDFAGEELKVMKNSLYQTTVGRYRCNTPGMQNREIVIGDTVYEGKLAVESVYSHLQMITQPSRDSLSKL